MARKSNSSADGDSFLLAIALFKFIKGVALIALTFGAIKLLHKDVQAEVEHWIDMLRIDPDNRYVGGLLTKLNLVHTKQLKELTFLSAFYAALFLTEGTGLLLRKRWAEWLTVVATALFLPIEIYEMARKLSAAKGIIFVVNIAIVIYLVQLIRRKERS
ncbi:MAG TPA: DUF2127 domain-containing protein [Chthoniobacterales bacterium]|jgi:uncharacterized membrane protein (DUF2068 family)